jgi:hypothetical protein
MVEFTRIPSLVVAPINMFLNIPKFDIDVILCLTEHHAMEAYWGIGGIAPLIL